MTREESIEFIAQSVKSDVDMAKVADAIKVLEQEPILDKIRAEIAEFEEKVFHRTEDYSDYAAVRYCLEIIDKYRAESEDKECK